MRGSIRDFKGESEIYGQGHRSETTLGARVRKAEGRAWTLGPLTAGSVS